MILEFIVMEPTEVYKHEGYMTSYGFLKRYPMLIENHYIVKPLSQHRFLYLSESG